jgi:hypothetical protein
MDMAHKLQLEESKAALEATTMECKEKLEAQR